MHISSDREIKSQKEREMKIKFWSIVNQAKINAKDLADRANQLEKLLMTLSADEVIEFNNVYQQKMVDAYRWDLWGIADVVMGGCSNKALAKLATASATTQGESNEI
jgi:hypothetical protein